MSKGICHQAWQPDFDSLDPHGEGTPHMRMPVQVQTGVLSK